jgi:hypothetical protein
MTPIPDEIHKHTERYATKGGEEIEAEADCLSLGWSDQLKTYQNRRENYTEKMPISLIYMSVLPHVRSNLVSLGGGFWP